MEFYIVPMRKLGQKRHSKHIYIYNTCHTRKMTGKRNILDNILALNSNEDLHDSEVIKNTVYVYEFNSYSFDLFANHIYLNDIELELTHRCSNHILELFHT